MRVAPGWEPEALGRAPAAAKPEAPGRAQVCALALALA